MGANADVLDPGSDPAGPGLMSVRSCAVTPSLLHSSHPAASLPAKSSVPFITAMPSLHPKNGESLRTPSRTMKVPAVVPSLLHNADPMLKNRTPFPAARRG